MRVGFDRFDDVLIEVGEAGMRGQHVNGASGTLQNSPSVCL